MKLFDVVGLKPQAGANFKGKKAEKSAKDEAIKRTAKQPGKKVKEIVGDGEEIEVEDGEELSKNEIDAIYNKYDIHSSLVAWINMTIPEPSTTIALWVKWNLQNVLTSLSETIKSRPSCGSPTAFMHYPEGTDGYNSWMHSLETGAVDARAATSMHPLWSEYVLVSSLDTLVNTQQIRISRRTYHGRRDDRSYSRRKVVLFQSLFRRIELGFSTSGKELQRWYPSVCDAFNFQLRC